VGDIKALPGFKAGRQGPLCRQHLRRSPGNKWGFVRHHRVCRLHSFCLSNNLSSRRNILTRSTMGSISSILTLCSSR
jgi:hypothetical protein